MSKCLSCLHYEVCDYRINEEDITVAECTQFTDRSEWIHLSCKVGDTVYYFAKDFGTVLPYFVENINFAYLGSENELYVCTYVCTIEANCSNEYELLDSIDFEPVDIGKTVFLTREEAEKALEGKKRCRQSL